MCSKIAAVLTVALLLATASAASAGIAQRQLLIGPRGSMGLPIGDYPITGRTWSYLKNDVKTGWAFGALVDKMVSSRVSVGAQVDYNIHSMRTSELQTDLRQQGYEVEPDFTWKTMQFTGHARYYVMPERALSLFGQVGAGLYLNKFSPSYVLHGSNGLSVDVPRSQSKTDFGVNFGPGMMLQVGPSTNLTLEAIFHNVFTKNQSMSFLNITAGVVFSIMPE